MSFNDLIYKDKIIDYVHIKNVLLYHVIFVKCFLEMEIISGQSRRVKDSSKAKDSREYREAIIVHALSRGSDWASTETSAFNASVCVRSRRPWYCPRHEIFIAAWHGVVTSERKSCLRAARGATTGGEFLGRQQLDPRG